MNKFHSVTLDVAKCVGCTACLKRCPTEAIRIRERRARIIDERCIDCGECIRICEHHAKVATTNPLSAINRYRTRSPCPRPRSTAQFKNLQAAAAIPAALKMMGFDYVCEVAHGADNRQPRDHGKDEGAGRAAPADFLKAARRWCG